MAEATTATTTDFQRSDRVLLVSDDGRGATQRVLVRLDGTTTKLAGVGIIDLAKLEGLAPGDSYQLGRTTHRLYRPSGLDLMTTIRRKAQIVTPKDAAMIIGLSGIGPGSVVVEAGIGSGALTIALANAVGPTGHVHNHEIRDDFRQHAMSNLEQAGLDDRVSTHLGDVTAGIPQRDVDAVILDMPTPWHVVGHAKEALRPGGTFVAYTPVVQQMQRTVEALRDHGFWDIRALEVLVRDWAVIDGAARGGKADGGARPAFEMLGHTAFLSTGRAP